MDQALQFVAKGAQDDGYGVHRDVEMIEKAMSGMGTKDERLSELALQASYTPSHLHPFPGSLPYHSCALESPEVRTHQADVPSEVRQIAPGKGQRRNKRGLPRLHVCRYWTLASQHPMQWAFLESLDVRVSLYVLTSPIAFDTLLRFILTRAEYTMLFQTNSFSELRSFACLITRDGSTCAYRMDDVSGRRYSIHIVCASLPRSISIRRREFNFNLCTGTPSELGQQGLYST
jgi:hypothetical protein